MKISGNKLGGKRYHKPAIAAVALQTSQASRPARHGPTTRPPKSACSRAALRQLEPRSPASRLRKEEGSFRRSSSTRQRSLARRQGHIRHMPIRSVPVPVSAFRSSTNMRILSSKDWRKSRGILMLAHPDIDISEMSITTAGFHRTRQRDPRPLHRRRFGDALWQHSVPPLLPSSHSAEFRFYRPPKPLFVSHSGRREPHDAFYPVLASLISSAPRRRQYQREPIRSIPASVSSTWSRITTSLAPISLA